MVSGLLLVSDAPGKERVSHWREGWRKTDQSCATPSVLLEESVLLPWVVRRVRSHWSEISGEDERRESGFGGLK